MVWLLRKDERRELDFQVQRQQVVELDGGHFDVLTTEEEAVWFDVTDLVAAAARSSINHGLFFRSSRLD